VLGSVLRLPACHDAILDAKLQPVVFDEIKELVINS
jgi:hypothetical protein